MVSDGYVKYKEAEVHRSAIMQDFQDNEKKIKEAEWRPFWILLVQDLSYVILKCEPLHFVLYSWSSYFAFFLGF